MIKFINFFKLKEYKKLSKNLIMILVINALVSLGLGLSNLFLNIYIWKISNDIGLVIKYNMIIFTALPITFIFAGWMSKRIGLRINMIIGMVTYLIFYSLVFYFKESVINYLLLIGIIRGMASGFYYCGYNVLSYDYSKDGNRDFYYSISGIISSIIGMVTPLISGFIIFLFNNLKGYYVIFGLSMAIFIITSVLSLKLPNVFSKSKYYFAQTFGLAFRKPSFRKAMLSSMIGGFNDGSVTSPIISILIFMLVSQELVVGNYSFWTAITAIVVNFFAGRIINPDNRVKYLAIGKISIGLASLILLFKINIITFWIFGLITAIAGVFGGISSNTISLSIISSIPKVKERRIEAIVTKDTFLSIGRFISLLIFAVLSSHHNLIIYFLAVISMMQVGIWLLLRSAHADIKKTHIKKASIDIEQKLLFGHTFNIIGEYERIIR